MATPEREPAAERNGMDPQAAWNELLDAVDRRQWDLARDRAEALLDWMRKGGVPPQTAAITMRPQWNRSMAEFGCYLALQFVSRARKRCERNKD